MAAPNFTLAVDFISKVHIPLGSTYHKTSCDEIAIGKTEKQRVFETDIIIVEHDKFTNEYLYFTNDAWHCDKNAIKYLKKSEKIIYGISVADISIYHDGSTEEPIPF